MALETGTYISDFNSSNPAAADGVTDADNHMRWIKSAILATFPNINGAVTTTLAQLNFVTGVTSAIQTQIDTNTAAIAGKASLASPAFTGTPTAPTAAVDTNTTQLATTAFVVAQAGASVPAMDGTGTTGTSKRYARDDHIHPTDTSRAPLASPAFTGNPTAPTPTAGDNDTSIATTAFVTTAVGSGGVAPHAPVVKTSGTSYTTPANCTRIQVEVIGGGGGGGAGGSSGAAAGAGGGGCAKKFYTVTPSTAYTYAVGASGASASNGGNSTFTDGTTLITGGGGLAGVTATGALVLGGAGGTATNGDVNIPGEPGSWASGVATGGSGDGGGSGLGYGSGGQGRVTTGVGIVGTGFGGGGSGGYNATNAGGAGAAGAVIITEYY